MEESGEPNEVSKEQESCGRVSFREADLAYLVIDKERMFPLAELLASLFNNTARTTLFTRMEKIDTRRHFCNAEEIKLLKTVNGIHGSSAICTLIPEADVKKYCGVYVDRTIDLKQFAKGKKTRKLTAKDKGSRKSKVSESSKSTSAVNNDEENQMARNTSDDKDNIINPLKKKIRNTSSKRRVNGEAKVKDSRKEQNKLSNNESQALLGKVLDGKDSQLLSLSEHVTNGTQTVSLLSEPVVKPRNKRKAKDCKNHIEQNKRPRDTDEVLNTLYPSSKPSTENSDGNEGEVDSRCSSTVSLENSHSSCLNQCLTNANSEILFSDSSSNDSGFGSTATLGSTCRETSSSSAARGKPNEKLGLAMPKKIKLTLPSPTKLDKNKATKRIKLQKGLDCKNMSKQVDPSLSPPALVIKRQNNTWQVETKTEIESKAKIPRKILKTAKKKLKWSSAETLKCRALHLENGTSNGQTMSKNERRKKQQFSDKANGALSEERNAVKKKRMGQKRPRNGALLQGSTLDPFTASNDPMTNFYLKGKNKGLARKSGRKKDKHSEKMRISQTLDKVKVAHSSNIAMTTSAGSSLTSSSKRISNASKTFKVNKNFKFMSSFSGFPFLSMRDGDLSPTYSMSVPDNIKKPSSLPLWKWHLGAPVVRHDPKGKSNFT
ncbi:uncharacterized protein LOC116288591 [Actinia tenebrosa]|uniref:Uncharacterized protein LOC116288591 n=1 Tax=Actinia tenebrosa TaxID=6105 RepID=A0A6P8H4I4_ACTTE|nr:uncharacterized protein LOC116288591 [Actinia tenebrosa]